VVRVLAGPGEDRRHASWRATRPWRFAEATLPRFLVEDSSPWLSVYGFRDLGEVGHPAAVWLFQLGIEQPQDRDVDAVTFTRRPNNRFNVLPQGVETGTEAGDRPGGRRMSPTPTLQFEDLGSCGTTSLPLK
jgi:hypothetical protein